MGARQPNGKRDMWTTGMLQSLWWCRSLAAFNEQNQNYWHPETAATFHSL